MLVFEFPMATTLPKYVESVAVVICDKRLTTVNSDNDCATSNQMVLKISSALHGILQINYKMASTATCSTFNYYNKQQDDINSKLRTVYAASVSSVKPQQLIPENLHYDEVANELFVGHDRAIRISLAHKRCHVIGFGKAALGMALATERILGDRMASGLLSVPVGQSASEITRLEIYEGAAGNLPDVAAATTARRILDRCHQLSGNDVLIALVSGGGSALMALPVPPVSIDEKRQLCRRLAACGANIHELNTVRTALSLTKGGGLAVAARRCSHIVTLIISDVIGDRSDVIASGPTVLRNTTRSDDSTRALDILNRYLPIHCSDVAPSVFQVLQTQQQEQQHQQEPQQQTCRSPSTDLIIGSNRIACKAAADACQPLLWLPVVMSTCVQGDVKELAAVYMRLARVVCDLRRSGWNDDDAQRITELAAELYSSTDNPLGQLQNVLQICAQRQQRPICLIMGGEPTVTLPTKIDTTHQPPPLGGRSLQLALLLSEQLFRLPADDELRRRVTALFAGTDGIDGTTQWAGAIASAQVGSDYAKQHAAGGDPGQQMLLYAELCESGRWFGELCAGKWLVQSADGHTGTNVMDLHLLLIG